MEVYTGDSPWQLELIDDAKNLLKAYVHYF